MQFHAYPVWLNVGIFLVAAVFVWMAGTRPAAYAETIGIRTKLSHALLGLILLERTNRTLLRMGLHSIAVLAVYVVAIVGLYWLR